MIKVYNNEILAKNQRFLQALLYGIPTAILLGIVYGLFTRFIHVEFSAYFVLAGYLIGLVIQKKGRGVQLKFSILGAVLAFFSFIIGDMIYFFGFDVFFSSYVLNAIIFSFQHLAGTNLSSLLSLLFRIGGIYYAYLTARII